MMACKKEQEKMRTKKNQYESMLVKKFSIYSTTKNISTKNISTKTFLIQIFFP